MKKITFIGLGKMGTAIATRMLESGLALTVYNRTKSKAQPLAEKGAVVADSIKEAVADADIIFSSLLDDFAVIETTTGSSGILEHMKTSAIHIGLSTILPSTAEQIYKAHQKHGSHYISGAVLGVPKVATAGELTTFCAGDAGAIASCEEIMQTFSKTVINLGDQAKFSLIMKISMNYALITSLELISELYSFAEMSGLDLEIVQQGLHQIYAHPAFKLYVDKIKDRDFDDVNFNMKGGLKDVSVFQKAFTDVGVTPKLANLVKDRFTSALADGMENKDWSAIYEVIRKESGLD